MVIRRLTVFIARRIRGIRQGARKLKFNVNFLTTANQVTHNNYRKMHMNHLQEKQYMEVDKYTLKLIN